MTQDSVALSVVMITLNEEQSVQSVVSQIREVDSLCEILIVDSSTDRTPAIAESLGCRVIRQYPPRGYGPALELALRSASGNTVITMDCDNTYPPSAISKLRAEIDSGFDVVSATRLNSRPANMPVLNYVANTIFAKLAFLICGVRTTDVHTGMRAYRKRLIDSFKFDPHGMALPVELYVGPDVLGYKCKEIPIEYFERTGVSKLRPIEGTYWTLKRLWKWRRFANNLDFAKRSDHI